MGQTVKRFSLSIGRGAWSRLIRRLRLKQAFMVYVIYFLLMAFTLIVLCMNVLEYFRDDILSNAVFTAITKYADGPDIISHVYEHVSLMGAALTIEAVDGNYFYVTVITPGGVYSWLGIAEIVVFVVVPCACLYLAARRFYIRKLREPLSILADAAKRIGESDLDFTITYDSPDELGRLCADFERMRSSVLIHETNLWRDLEERRRQTAALSHDLRTPLTVLKGQAELLEASYALPEKAAATVRMMHGHILRMERYVAGLNELRRLEDIDVRRAPTDLQELAASLASTAEMLCQSAGLAFSMTAAPVIANVDGQLIQRVFDNLLANALRYARSRVSAELAIHDGRLLLTLRDDGPGFSAAALAKASEPFWSEAKTGASAHLGLGLNIVDTLCRRCGGRLLLGNASSGAVVTAEFGRMTP